MQAWTGKSGFRRRTARVRTGSRPKMAPAKPMTRALVDAIDERLAVEDLLTALEYGSRKEEKDILDALLTSLGQGRTRKAKLSRAIASQPGFEQFFFAVLNLVRPFSSMLAETYQFLNERTSTTYRRAKKVLVSRQEARAHLAFDLSNFPKEMLEVLTSIDRFGYVVDLQFSGVMPTDPLDTFWECEAGKAWRAVGPNWDSDFYDEFHRALSYAQTILGGATSELLDQAETLVAPVLDRCKPPVRLKCWRVRGDLDGYWVTRGRCWTSWIRSWRASRLVSHFGGELANAGKTETIGFRSVWALRWLMSRHRPISTSLKR